MRGRLSKHTILVSSVDGEARRAGRAVLHGYLHIQCNPISERDDVFSRSELLGLTP